MIDYTKVDGVMVGRAALGRPWLISQIHEYLEKGIKPQKIGVETIKETLLKHITGLTEYYGEKVAIALSRKYVCWYCKNLRNAKRFRENYVRIDNMEQALNEIELFFTDDNLNIAEGSER